MNRKVVTAIFALSAVLAITELAQAQSSTGQQTGLTNPGFEEPRVEEGRFVLVETMPGWKTTDTHFEIWGTGFKEVAAHEGTQFVELNAYIDGTLYQDSTGIQRGSVLEFTFAHRGRSGDDTMKMTITDLGADNSLEGGDDTVLFTNQYTTGKDAWAVYDSTTEQKIKALGNTVRFAYGAILTATGELGEGNLLDAANFGIGVVSMQQAAIGIKVGSWEIHQAGPPVAFDTSDNAGLVAALDKATIPPQKDAGWKQASDSTVNIHEKSAITNRDKTTVDYTFFQVIVNVPEGAKIKTFQVNFDKVDDSARAWILNSKHPEGAYFPDADVLAGGQNVTVAADFKDKVVEGENRIVITQYDNMPFLNTIKGIHIIVDGQEVKPGMLPTTNSIGKTPVTMDTASNSETNSLGMEFKLIPAGTFLMGSPDSEAGRENDEVQHEVTITHDYYIGITEVTQSQWQQVMGTSPWKGQEQVIEGNDIAASYISWNDAGEFCRKLSQQEGRTYRLPTEAEWEYACRGGTTMAYSFGDDVSQLEQSAWYRDSEPNHSSQVKQKSPNGFGLYDMHGNLLEFCQDWYGAYPQGSVTDPPGPSSGTNRIGRGGSFLYEAPVSRSACRRFVNDPAERFQTLGLRVVLVPGSDSGQLALNETPPENAMKLDVDGGAFAFGYRTTAEPGFNEFPNTDSPHPGITRRNITDGDYFSYAQNTLETEYKAQESDLVLYPAKAEGSGALHPGKNPGDVAIARFTAMDDGEYHFKITAELIEENPTGAGVTIYIDGQAVAETQLSEHLVPWTTSPVVKLAKGQTVDIAVDSGVDQNWEKDHVLVTAKAWTTGPSIATVAMVNAGDSATNEANAAERIITRDLENQKGAVWTEQKIDFNENFRISSEIYLGTKDDGADGLALVFQAKGNHIVSDGKGLGYEGVSPSIAIEFDTYENRDECHDPVEDHVGLRTDGDPMHIPSDYVEVENLEDGKYHPITFEWNASRQTFDLSLDGKQIFKGRRFPENGLAGQQVYFGFTAATGLYSNEHKVRSIYFIR